MFCMTKVPSLDTGPRSMAHSWRVVKDLPILDGRPLESLDINRDSHHGREDDHRLTGTISYEGMRSETSRPTCMPIFFLTSCSGSDAQDRKVTTSFAI